MIKPLSDRIVVREDKEGRKESEKQTSFGIVIPDNASQTSRHKEGIVIAVGRGRLSEPKQADVAGMQMNHFSFFPMEVKVGDRVMYTFGDEYTVRGEKFSVLKETDILAIIE